MVCKHRELHALRVVCDGLLVRPTGRRDTPAQIVELLLREVDAEGADRCVRGHGAERAGKEAEGSGGSSR